MERNVWRKSTRSSGSGQCVEIMMTDDAVLVRDTKDRTKLAHVFTYAEWAAFTGGVKDGEFDL
jgi:hypothetical protein